MRCRSPWGPSSRRAHVTRLRILGKALPDPGSEDMDLVLHQHPFASYCQKRSSPSAGSTSRSAAASSTTPTPWRACHNPLADGPPALRDETADLLPESTTIIEHVDQIAGRKPTVARSCRRACGIASTTRTSPRRRRGSSATASGPRAGATEARRRASAGRVAAGGRRGFTVAECTAAPTLFSARAVHRWDVAGQANLTRYFRDLVARPSVARMVDEARPLRGVFRCRGPTDIDEIG